jgi:hypothetical protein
VHSVWGAHTRSIVSVGGDTSYCVAPHALASAHTRLDVAVGGTVSNSPPAQLVHAEHALWFALAV